ncbi:MAG: GDP-mannose 4,6-dehydratase [Spirochaetota bacterium]
MSSTYLITGIGGFIGSHIAEELLKNDEKVIGLDNLTSGNLDNIKYLQSLKKNLHFTEGSILDVELLESLSAECDYIIHHAALVSVVQSIEEPNLTHKINTEGTLNILNIARKNKNIKKLIFASSAATYGNIKELPIKEEDASEVLSPYAATKKTNELYAQAYSNSYNLDIVGLRYFNVFGPRQDPSSPYSGVVSIFINNLKKGKDLIIYGDGKQTRDFIYVKDVANVNIQICKNENLKGYNVLNIGTGNQISINEIAGVLGDELGVKPNIIHKEERKGDIKYSCADISRLKEKLNFTPKYDFKQGIREYFDYLKP